MEKKDKPYTVQPYDPNWKRQYEQERKTIINVFGEKARRIEHIGSTAVEGMWAKPQIDILVIVDTLSVISEIIDQMESRGYTYQKLFDKYNERYFTRDAPSGERLVSVHVMSQNNPQAQSHLYLREYLRKHPRERDLYSQAKRAAYESGVNREEYPKRKREVLNALLERASKWADENQIK